MYSTEQQTAACRVDIKGFMWVVEENFEGR